MQSPPPTISSNPYGILNCYKPSGMTSRDVVNLVQRAMRPAKVGHAGTLDPIASGVLLVPVGWTVRLVEYLQMQPKCYRGVFRIDAFSDSLDTETEVQTLRTPVAPDLVDLQAASKKLIGRIQQVPPNYSALKVAGKRAYDRARKGEVFQLSPREAIIHSLTVTDYSYPFFTIEVVCGSGTYIRTLGDDLAKQVSSRAIMTELERTAIGDFQACQALDVCNLTKDEICQHLHPAKLAVGAFPQRTLSSEQLDELMLGKFLEGRLPYPKVAAMDEAGNLRGILIPRREGKFGACRMFPQWMPYFHNPLALAQN